MNLDAPRSLPVKDLERFKKYVDGYGLGGCCWVWTGCVKPNGYGLFHLTIDGRHRKIYPHRLSYELHVGPIPADLQIDHVCRNRRCVNPEHLEAVTCKENLHRGVHPNILRALSNTCHKGHDLTKAYMVHNGRRNCRECATERRRRYTEERRA